MALYESLLCLLALDGASCQAADDLALEDHHQQEERCRGRDNRRHGKHHIPLGLCGSRKAAIAGIMVRLDSLSTIVVTAKSL